MELSKDFKSLFDLRGVEAQTELWGEQHQSLTDNQEYVKAVLPKLHQGMYQHMLNCNMPETAAHFMRESKFFPYFRATKIEDIPVDTLSRTWFEKFASKPEDLLLAEPQPKTLFDISDVEDHNLISVDNVKVENVKMENEIEFEHESQGDKVPVKIHFSHSCRSIIHAIIPTVLAPSPPWPI